MKKKYKMEKNVQNVTSGVLFFDKIDNIIGSSPKVARLPHGIDRG